jgi:hypothetical protein
MMMKTNAQYWQQAIEFRDCIELELKPLLVAVSVSGVILPLCYHSHSAQRADCDVKRRKSFYWTL